MTFDSIKEKEEQEKWGKLRSGQYLNYRNVNAYYGGVAVLEEARGNSVLDLACGEGKVLNVLRQKFSRLVGVDASGYALEKAREKHPDVEFHDSLIEEFNTDERFDTVCLLNVLEHVFDPVGLIKKAASFLKDDGILIIHVPNAAALNRKIAVKMGTLSYLEELSPFDLKTTGHRRYYKMDTLMSDIKEAGLTVDHTGGVMLKMLSMAQMDWFLENGLWQEGGFGWGRVGEEKEKDWRALFCKACYEVGKEYPEECNIIYAICKK